MRKRFTNFLFFILIIFAQLFLPKSVYQVYAIAANEIQNSPQTVSYTPEYEQYLKDVQSGDTAKYGELIPYASAPELPTPPITRVTYPIKFDPRFIDNPYLTPVKNQGAPGVCWAFASIASVETLVSLLSNQKNDYSEEHLRFYYSIQNPDLIRSDQIGGLMVVEILMTPRFTLLVGMDRYILLTHHIIQI